LLDPTAAGSNELVALLELEQPCLEFLCPLARAIYWLETNRQGSIDVNGVLGSLWLIDESEARGTGEYGEDYACVKEVVHHSIITAFGGIEIDLGFESSTTMVHYKEFWPAYLRAVSAHAIELNLAAEHSHLIDQWFAELDAEAKSLRRSPDGYPTDSGEFIGTCRYTLTSVNGLPIEGPTFSDTYHEQDWGGLNEDYPQRWDGDSENSSFCWLHYLCREQAEQSGITAKGKQALGRDKDYPEWLPKKLAADLEDQWINSDQISDSYGNGMVIVAPSTDGLIAVGCGADWDPSDPESQVDLEVAEWGEYPANASPLLQIELSRGDEALPPELERLLPYLLKLSSMR
jgi:hypothetical protein